MNVTGSAKWAADHLPDVSDESLATLRGAGITFARVLTFWSAIEPEQGVYDEAYLAGLDAFLSRMDAAGVAVMLDMHQDVWGVGFGGIRSADDERCAFGPWQRPCRFIALEPSTHVNLLQSRLLFPEAEGLVFAPHFYPTYAEEGTGFDGDLTNEIAHLDGIIAHGQEASLPVILGEFGIFSALGGEHDYVRGLQDLFEAHGASTAYWSWDPNDTSGVVGSDDGPGYMLPAWYRPWLHRVPSAGLEIEPLADGMRARFEAAEGDELLAVVPEACASDLAVDGGAIVGEEGVLRTIAPAGSGAVQVTVRGCLAR